jgi:hypothetical protein
LFVGEEDSTLSRCVYCVYFLFAYDKHIWRWASIDDLKRLLYATQQHTSAVRDQACFSSGDGLQIKLNFAQEPT